MIRLYYLFAAIAAAALSIPALAGGNTICFEAESPHTVTSPLGRAHAADNTASAPLRRIEDASADSYLGVPQGAGKPPKVNGRATFVFPVQKEGRYFLWARVWWLDGCGNSLGMHLDDNPAFTFGQDGTYQRWHWFKAPGNLQQLKLSPGLHTLTISNREDGAYIDQLLLTRHERYVPVGIEDCTVPAEEPLPHPATGREKVAHSGQ